jgi:hypothetical protein
MQLHIGHRHLYLSKRCYFEAAMLIRTICINLHKFGLIYSRSRPYYYLRFCGWPAVIYAKFRKYGVACSSVKWRYTHTAWWSHKSNDSYFTQTYDAICNLKALIWDKRQLLEWCVGLLSNIPLSMNKHPNNITRPTIIHRNIYALIKKTLGKL